MPKNIYKLKDGTIVPGCTTICNQLDKPQLIDWAWKLGQQGIDWREQRDSAGDTGTLVHEMIMTYLRDNAVDVSTPPDVVYDCFKKFDDWWLKNVGLRGEVELVEEPLVSEKLRFGGQPDLYIIIDDRKRRLIDIKTSNGIYENYWYQLAGYGILLKENGYRVDEYQILWLPKDNRFDCPIRTDLRKEKRIFKHLLGIYYDRR